MELAAGRSVVSSKETASGRSGVGAGGSESGRGSSGRNRESDYRSSVADDGRKPRERDYIRDGAGGVGRGRDRDGDTKEWGASKGVEKPLQRWRGAVESGRSGSSRLYLGGDIRDKGYRYQSHHRDRSRCVKFCKTQKGRNLTQHFFRYSTVLLIGTHNKTSSRKCFQKVQRGTCRIGNHPCVLT